MKLVANVVGVLFFIVGMFTHSFLLWPLGMAALGIGIVVDETPRDELRFKLTKRFRLILLAFVTCIVIFVWSIEFRYLVVL